MSTTKLILNSAQRTSGTSHKCSYTLTNPGIRADAYEVLKIEIPHSFYNITDANNTIAWVDELSASLTTTLTNGNYSTTELLTHIAAEMNSDATGVAVYTVTTNNNTKKIFIANDTVANFSINWATNDVTKQLAWDLGFYPTQTDEDRGRQDPVNLTGAATYTSSNQYWIGTPKNINIKSNLAQMARRPAAFTVMKGGGVFNILDQMLVTTVAGEITVYEPSKTVKVPISNNMIFEITFELLDNDFEPLDLNGRDWSISLLMHNLK